MLHSPLTAQDRFALSANVVSVHPIVSQRWNLLSPDESYETFDLSHSSPEVYTFSNSTEFVLKDFQFIQVSLNILILFNFF